jgi:excinuclease ABC subunit B
VILYADNMNDSLKATLEITSKRRQKQEAYNRKHGITPKGVKRAIEESMKQAAVAEPERIFGEEEDIKDAIAEMEKEMLEAADRLDFERAAILRDQIARIKGSGASKKSKSSFSPGGIKAARMKPY